MIDSKTAEPFAVVVCDINGLKQINDTLGHKAGDELICQASEIICNLFKRSPVFRIGGDEFVVILAGLDYDEREFLIKALNVTAEENKNTGGVVIAAGMTEYTEADHSFLRVFERADSLMYARKKQLKEG